MLVDEQKRLIEANKVFINIRYIYVLSVFATAVLSKVLPGLKANINLPFWKMVLILAGAFALNLLYVVLSERLCKYSLFLTRFSIYSQIIFDIFLVTLIIFYAGGLSSISFLYYYFIIVAAAFFFSFKQIMVVASVASLFYGGLISLQLFEISPYLPRYNLESEIFLAHNFNAVFTNISAVIGSLYIVAFISGILAKNLRAKEKEVIFEHKRSDLLIDNLKDGLIFLDSAGELSTINKQAGKLLAFDTTELIGLHWKKISKNNYPDLFSFLSNKDQKLIYEPKNKPGSIYEFYNYQIDYSGDAYSGKVKIVRDISREEYLKKMKTEFISIVSHQLRTPLSGIKSALDLLSDGDYGELNKEQKRIIKSSFNYTNNLIGIVDDLLTVNATEEGRYDYQFKAVDILFLMKDICERYEEEAKKKKISFSLIIKENRESIYLDSTKIKLAISGLLENALCYTPKMGKIVVTVLFKTESIVISISDTGIGIPENNQKKVFTKFFRSNNAIRVKTGGNGLDLFVAKNIIESHQGKIWFSSKEGKGSIFYIELPIKSSRTK